MDSAQACGLQAAPAPVNEGAASRDDNIRWFLNYNLLASSCQKKLLLLSSQKEAIKSEGKKMKCFLLVLVWIPKVGSAGETHFGEANGVCDLRIFGLYVVCGAEAGQRFLVAL